MVVGFMVDRRVGHAIFLCRRVKCRLSGVLCMVFNGNIVGSFPSPHLSKSLNRNHLPIRFVFCVIHSGTSFLATGVTALTRCNCLWDGNVDSD